MPPDRNVAIFIDMENLFGGYSGDIGSVPITDILVDIKAAVSRLRIGAAVSVTRAYANWADSRLGKYRREMMEHGVEPVQVFSFSSAVKNAADIEMVVDVLEVAARAMHVNVFVLVSGDGGFVPLVRRLHALGKYVMVATTKERAEQSTSKLLQAVADHFLVSGAVAPLISVEAETEATASVISESEQVKRWVGSDAEHPTTAKVVSHIRTLLYPNGDDQLSDLWANHDGRINGAALGSRVRERWPNLDWRQVGYRSLGALVKDHLGLDLQRQLASDTAPVESEVVKPASASATVDDGDLIGLEARSRLKDAIHLIVAQQGFEHVLADAGGKMKLSPVGVYLKKELPDGLKKWAGFSSLTFALRFCLSGTAYCVGESDDEARELFLSTRADAEHDGLILLPDVVESELGEAHAVWELARRATPPIVMVDPAIFRDVTEYVLDNRPTGSIVDVIDLVAEALPPYYEAAHIRGALNLLRRCSVIVGPADYVSCREDVQDGRQVQAMVRQELLNCLNRHGWPINPSTLDEMLGIGGEWN